MKPMMSEQEINLVHSHIEPLAKCLEWGSGGSTIYFPDRNDSVSWLSIEHNGHWVQKLANDLPNNANVVWVPDNEWYVDCVKHSGKFDFILIDGLHRERCLEVAREIISEDGVILLHDSGRKEYQEFIKANDGEKLIDGEEPHEGFYKHRGLHLFRGKS